MKSTGTIVPAAALAVILIFAQAFAQESAKPETTSQMTPTETKTVTPVKEVAGQFEVEKFACGTGVEERELVGETTTFTPDVERIYCWTLITGCQEPTTVEHVWYYGGEEMARVALDIKYPRMRTWSYKTMMPEWVGDWKVEMIDESGEVLATSLIKVE